MHRSSTLNIRSTAAIVVDAWSDLGPIVATNLLEKLEPTLRALRSTGMAIVHAAHDREIHCLFALFLARRRFPVSFTTWTSLPICSRIPGLKLFIYLGYFSNMCVLQRSIGMIEMKHRGFDPILVRDASIAKRIGKFTERSMVPQSDDLFRGAQHRRKHHGRGDPAGVAAMGNHNFRTIAEWRARHAHVGSQIS